MTVHNVVDVLRFIGGGQQGTQALLQTAAGLYQWLHHYVTVLEEGLRRVWKIFVSHLGRIPGMANTCIDKLREEQRITGHALDGLNQEAVNAQLVIAFQANTLELG